MRRPPVHGHLHRHGHRAAVNVIRLVVLVTLAVTGATFASPPGHASAGGDERSPHVTIEVAPTALDAPAQCLAQVLVTFTNDSTASGFVTAEFDVPEPLEVSPGRVTSYYVAGYTWTMTLAVTVPSGTPPGTYPLAISTGRRSGVTVPVTVAPGGAHCLAAAHLSATATSWHVNVPPANAVDGDILSRWGVEYDPYQPGPQSITIDTGSAHDVTTLRYWPRQDGNTSGLITKYNVYVSADGQTFSLAGSGSWAFDNAMKTATVDATDVRYVRLEATEGGRDGEPQTGGYAVAAEIQLVSTS